MEEKEPQVDGESKCMSGEFLLVPLHGCKFRSSHCIAKWNWVFLVESHVTMMVLLVRWVLLKGYKGFSH